MSLGADPAASEPFDARRRLAALFDDHHERLYRLARRLSGDAEEARDLVQEAFLRAARRPREIPGGEAAQAWLARVVVNLCRDRRRRLQVRREASAAPGSTPPAPPDPEGAALASRVVEAALARLPPRRRAVVVLHELEGMDAAGIARLLGLAQVTVRWHLAAGRRQLRALLLPGTGGEGSDAQG